MVQSPYKSQFMSITISMKKCRCTWLKYQNSSCNISSSISMSQTWMMIMMMMFMSLVSSARTEHRIVKCLTKHNINNFTAFVPSSKSQDDHANDVYNHLLNFSLQNLRFTDPAFPKPAAIVLPSDVDQLVKTVQCCKKVALEIKVRCGGHSYEGTSYVATSRVIPFVIIDMMNLNSVSVNLETETAWVQGGATLGETYSAIAAWSGKHAFSAGSCPTVGIGGHIAGGGFGLLSRKYGLAADNVLDALLVDPRGRLLDRESMGEDVFWAIRGGGGGAWGIVYAWKIKLLSVPRVVTAFMISRQGMRDHVADLVNKWQHVAPKLEDDFYLSCTLGAGLPQASGTGISATFRGLYLGPKNEAVATVSEVFPELGIREQECREMSWIESVLLFSGLSEDSSVGDLKNRYLEDKHYFKAKSDFVRSEIPMEGIQLAIDILEEEPEGYVILDAYGGFMERVSSEAIPFPHRQGNLYTIQYLVEWRRQEARNKEEEEQCIGWIRGFYEAMTPYVSWDPRAAYINYMDFDLGVNINSSNSKLLDEEEDAVKVGRVWGEKYFLGNYNRLVKAKTLIDPHNFFRNQQTIPPFSSNFFRNQHTIPPFSSASTTTTTIATSY